MQKYIFQLKGEKIKFSDSVRVEEDKEMENRRQRPKQEGMPPNRSNQREDIKKWEKENYQ